LSSEMPGGKCPEGKCPEATLYSPQCAVNPLMGTLKPLSNGNTVIGTLTIDGWAVTFGTGRKGMGGLRSRPVPLSLYQM